MPVGNDIVDLRDPETRPGAVHPRFDHRVFTRRERSAMEEHSLPERLRWTLWAAKESAFKAARQLDPSVRFIPRRFAVRLLDDARAEVRHRVGRFQVWLEEAHDWIHAVAAPDGEEDAADGGAPPWRVDFLRDDDGAGPSERARELAREALAPLLSLEPGELKIPAVAGIPEVRAGARRLALDLSLSHHGRLVACAWSGEG